MRAVRAVLGAAVLSGLVALTSAPAALAMPPADKPGDVPVCVIVYAFPDGGAWVSCNGGPPEYWPGWVDPDPGDGGTDPGDPVPGDGGTP